MKKYQIKASFMKIVAVEAENNDEAIEKANIEMFDNMALQNETLENELKWEIVCADCGVSLLLDEDQEVGKCVQCDNIK